MNRSDSIVKIAAALLKAQRVMGDATKGAKNPFFKSSYADLNAIREATTPALNENGITVLQPTVSIDGRSYVETVLLHDSGEFLSSLTEIVCAKANDPQAHGSGVSYARRYGLQSFLNVGAVDDDGEKSMGRGAPVKAAAPTLTLASTPAQNNAPAATEQPKVEEAPKKTSSFRKPAAKPAVSTASTAVAEPNWD